MARGWLVHLREGAVYKLEGLDDEQLRWKPAPTANSLGAIVVHLGYAERLWFRAIFAGEEMDMSWRGDMFELPDGWSVADVVAFYRAETAAADAVLDAATLVRPSVVRRLSPDDTALDRRSRDRRDRRATPVHMDITPRASRRPDGPLRWSSSRRTTPSGPRAPTRCSPSYGPRSATTRAASTTSAARRFRVCRPRICSTSKSASTTSTRRSPRSTSHCAPADSRASRTTAITCPPDATTIPRGGPSDTGRGAATPTAT